jgi:molybdopterin-guanine dinucleotide biosynthesis protein A
MASSWVSAVVLAGGRASRFGGPKLTADLDGIALLDHVIGAVAAIADEVLVAGAIPDGSTAPAGPALRVVADEEPFEGPLAALAGALAHVRPGLAIVVGGDMPWLQPAVLEAMLARLVAEAAVDAVTLAAPATDTVQPPRRQVLPLAVRVKAAAAAARQGINDGDRSLIRLLDRLRSIEIPAPEWLALDPQARTLRDVDRLEDLLKMRGELR